VRIATMKAIDRRVGRALCALLGAVSPARPKAMPAPESVREIALVKFWGMGSIVLMTPAIALLRAKYPQARLTFVTQAANGELLKLVEGVDAVLPLELGRGVGAFASSLWQLVIQVRRARFDLWIDCEFLTRFSALLTGVSGAKVRAGFHASEVPRGRLHHVLLPFNSQWHMIDNFCVVASGDVSAPPMAALRPLQRFYADPEQALGLAQKLASRGLAPGEPYLVLNPNAGELALERRWSVENFAALADALASSFSGKFVVVGAAAERAYVARMLACVGARERVIDLSGDTSLKELVALFAQARVLVSNDTGPLHLACAVGTPTVAIFGPESPLLFGPRGTHHQVVYKGLACSPCLNIYNGRTVHCPYAVTHCVADLSVATVLAATLAQLERARTPVHALES
jgi:lipopolysaccharide heptosyltransferase II